MKTRIELWHANEYTYPMAFSFRPNLLAHLHEDDTDRPCMLVVPGGAYCFLSPTEGDAVADRFYAMGYQTFVLSYTTDLTITHPLKTQPMEDLSRAIRLVRARAEGLNVDPNRLAICGFSAGGHLCASICVHHMDVQDCNPQLQVVSNRPDAAILCYPVICSEAYTHRESMLALLGREPDAEALDYAANEKHVSAQTPPCFLWHTVTDDAVPVENSLRFAEACRKQGISYALHLFSGGPHGLATADHLWVEESWKDDHVMEQTYTVLEQLEQGRLQDIPDNWILDAFRAHGKNAVRDSFLAGATPNAEVAIWPQIAGAWLDRQFQKE